MFKLICWTSVAVGFLACLTFAKPTKSRTTGASGSGNSTQGSVDHNQTAGNTSQGLNASHLPHVNRPTTRAHQGSLSGNHSHHHGPHHGGNHTGGVKPPHFNQTQIDAFIEMIHNASAANNTDIIESGEDIIGNRTFIPARVKGGSGGGQQQSNMNWMLPFMMQNQNNMAARQDTGMDGGGGGAAAGGGGMDWMSMSMMMQNQNQGGGGSG
ncbi:hypothetical protein BV898_06770 [Hypsibius exemplaris]|uniref:Uncharacterized protein n=1 Tax=Hypsibius exemplaris TaxID=2072580 RepID=A0A1W0WVA2_HYPEX|nr:hypothetical protein BV898_06770 [Hypsibius exemplaris]